MSDKLNIPKVLILSPITPSPESVRAETLTYPKLAPAVEKHAPYEQLRSDRVWGAEAGSIEEQEAAIQLAQHYMLMGAKALQEVVRPDQRELWSERYTEATGQIYGMPDPDVARRLEQGETIDVSLEKTARVLDEYLRVRYAPVFEAIAVDESIDVLSPTDVADAFERGIAVLADQHDTDWAAWRVERNDEKSALSVAAGSKKVFVGMKRAAMRPHELIPLFAHEVLVHGLRGLNGAKRDKRLQTGLPGYLDAEEGLGVFVEYALSGDIPEKNIDRYTDIAYALGQIDGVRHTRAELLERALVRAENRNAKATSPRSHDDVVKAAYAHVNRIYRGSLGNEYIGVFTKDIAYHKGFLEVGSYIRDQLEAGKLIDDVMTYLLQGKFSPLVKEHVDYLLAAAKNSEVSG